ncbi:MAG TPA: DUF4388 domain-containing protein [Ktedonobacterales bacterium]|nr:DUF4388 domain-containing protein [Ktedonobacterales bacterium]
MDFDNQGGSQSRVLDGDLETLTLQSTLKMLALGNKTGVLSVQSGPEKMRIYLQDGAVTSLDEPDLPEPDLIDLLRSMGRLGPEQIMLIPQDARRDLASAMQFLVNTGDIGAAEELQRREFVVVQALSRAVRWNKGRFEFVRDATRRTGGMYTPSMAHPLNIDHVLLEALRQADERDNMRIRPAPRTARVRKVVSAGDSSRLSGLRTEEMWIYQLAEEHRPLYVIAYALLMPEGVAGAWLTTLIERGLVAPVDERLDHELERSMFALLSQARAQLEQVSRTAPERLMLDLTNLMGDTINALLAHHARFARALQARGEPSPTEAIRYIDRVAGPLVGSTLASYPRMDELARVEKGRLIYDDIKGLDKVVRGQELITCYWDATRMMHATLRQIYELICGEELGAARGGRKFDEIWIAFLRELDYEMGRLHQWYTAVIG